MNPYRAYQQQHGYTSWLRIDLLLALYDGAIDAVRAARDALKRRDAAAAKAPLAKGRLLVSGLVAAVDADRGDLATQFLRLYEFVHHGLGTGRLKEVEGALKVLTTLREGLQEIRPQAAEMERTGQIPAADALPKLERTA